MKNFKFLLIISLAILTSSINARVMVYYSYEDFMNKDGVEYDEYKRYGHAFGKVKLIFTRAGEKHKISCKEIWGFTYGEALFRIDHNHNQPARVMSVGEAIYYENGIAHLEMIRDKSETGSFAVGYSCYLSEDLTTEMVPMPSQPISDARRQIKKFRKQHPEYSELFACIGKNYNYLNVRSCIEKFQGE